MWVCIVNIRYLERLWHAEKDLGCMKILLPMVLNKAWDSWLTLDCNETISGSHEAFSSWVGISPLGQDVTSFVGDALEKTGVKQALGCSSLQETVSKTMVSLQHCVTGEAVNMELAIVGMPTWRRPYPESSFAGSQSNNDSTRDGDHGDRHIDSDQIDARKNDDDRLDRDDRGGSDDNDSRNGAHRDDASDIVDTNKVTPTRITMHDCWRLLNKMQAEQTDRLQDRTRIEAIADSLGPADVDYGLGAIDDYRGAPGSPPPRSPIATDDDDRNNRPSTPPPTKYKPAHLRGADTDHRTRRSPTRQQHACRADYRQNSDNEHSARSDRSNDRYEHANRSARSHDINDQRDSRSDRNARDDSDDARDDHHDLGSDRRFDGYDATRATHDVHDRRSCDNSDDYDDRGHHNDHSGGYSSRDDGHDGDCHSDYSDDHGDDCSDDCGSGYTD